MKDLAQFDIPPAVLQANEPIAVLVNVHLHVEAFIIELISRRLCKPDALDFERLNFPSKLGLAIALGAVPDCAAPPLRTINSLRNRIAHNLHTELTVDDGRLLREQISFIRPPDASDATLPRSQQVVLAARTLQAWLNGVVAVAESGALPMSRDDVERMVSERYPFPPDSDAPGV